MRGYVYKIESDCKSICYIGSTTQTLKNRFKDHLRQMNCSISQFFINPNYSFSNGCELLKSYDVVDIRHLNAYEQLYINKISCINKHAALQLCRVFQRREYSKLYRELNPYKARDYHEMNKEPINARKREYYTNNKDIINAKRASVRLTCECGISIRKADITKHVKTKRHIDHMSK